MAEVLTQSEIDALLQAVSSGNVDTEDGQAPTPIKSDWVAYDLTSQEKIVRGKLAGLAGIHERFSRLFRHTLSEALNKPVSVNFTNIDFIRFGDYLGNLIPPVSLNVFQMTNLRGTMVLVVSSKLAYSLVDAYYGGAERPYSKVGGKDEFTSIEQKMIQKMCRMAVHDLKESWRLNYPLELDYLRSESNPHFVGGIHSSETVAVVTFDVEFENLSGTLILILQVKALDPIQQSLSVNITTEVSHEGKLWEKHWKEEIKKIPLDLHVALGQADTSLTQIKDLKVGDTIALQEDAASPLTVKIEGISKLKGLMGVCRGNTALRITDFIESDGGNNG